MVELVDEFAEAGELTEFTEPGELTEELDEVDISELLLEFWPQFDGLEGRTFGFGGKGGGMTGMVADCGGVCTSITFVNDKRGAGIGLWLVLILSAGCCRCTGLKLARIFLNLCAALMFSLFFKKSGSSKFISTPR